LIRLALRVRRADAEIVLAELLTLAPSGVEEVSVSPDVVEYAVYGPPGELPTLPEVQAVVGGALVEVVTTEIPDDWAERWREFHRPLLIGDRLGVRPPWEAATGAALDLVVDPGQAFGTGAHATTRLCLELLLELPSPGGACVDLGSGSGVLGICAARLGWSPVLALDYDPLSVEATAENARVNGASVEARQFDLRSEEVPVAPLVLANLLRPLLLTWCDQMVASGADRPGAVIASGLLVEEADEVSAAFARAGLHEVERRSHGEWSALALNG
jgi:ribosomal protein L11 methyltransferase